MAVSFGTSTDTFYMAARVQATMPVVVRMLTAEGTGVSDIPTPNQKWPLW